MLPLARLGKVIGGGGAIFTVAALAPDLWLEMDGEGSLRGATAGVYTGSLNDEAAIDAALTGAEFCSAWNSRSPGTVNVAEATEANQPAWLTNAETIFDTAALDFTPASNHRLTRATPIDMSVGCSIAVVFETDSVALATQAIFNSTSGTADRFVLGLNTDQVRAGWFDTAFRGAVSSSALSANTRYVVQYYRNGLTGRMWVNGVEQVGGNSPTNLSATTARLTIGHRSDLAGASFDGRIAAVLAKGGADGWGVAHQAAIDTYLAAKYGV